MRVWGTYGTNEWGGTAALTYGKWSYSGCTFSISSSSIITNSYLLICLFAIINLTVC